MVLFPWVFSRIHWSYSHVDFPADGNKEASGRGQAEKERISLQRHKRRKKKPLATFVFAGSPGVGKTYLAETAAKELDIPCKRFNMSEFSDDMSAKTGVQSKGTLEIHLRAGLQL